MDKPGSKWRSGLERTRRGVFGRISSLFRDRKTVDEAMLESLEEVLIEGDIGMDAAHEIIESIRSHAKMKETSEEDIRILLKDRLLSLLDEKEVKDASQEKPHVILVVGVNGTGKTTTIGKLAYRYRQSGKKVLLAAADTFRAAAGDQLERWAKRAGAEIIIQPSGADPASVAYDALDAALARDVDVVIVDTAGRIHTRVNLMEELKKIRRVLGKRMPAAPHEVLLVLDATTGQNGLSQAGLFSQAVGVTGIALAKLDGTARGGIVVAIQKTLGIPVRWVGVGEDLEDLIPFDRISFVEGLLGDEKRG